MSPRETRAQLLLGLSAFEVLADEWNELASRAMTSTPFQFLEYQRSWWRHLGSGDLLTVTIRDRESKLVAIACLNLLDGVVQFNGCIEETDYLDLITTPEWAEPAWNSVFECIEGNGLADWTALDLCNVPADSTTNAILPGIAERRGLRFDTELYDVCPVIALPATFDDYLAGLDKKQRHEIRRKSRRAAAAKVEFWTASRNDDLAVAVDDFLSLLALSSSEKQAWLSEERRAVFHEVARAAMDSGTLNLMFLLVNNEKAAALFNFDYRDRIWVYNSGLNSGDFGHLSPGVVLTAKAIELAIDNQRVEFDFLRGDEPYKYRFGARDRNINRIYISRS